MKRLLVVLILLVAGVAGLGLYLGWLRFASDSADGKGNITLTVDTDKIQKDKGKGVGKVHDLGHQGKDKTVAPTEKGKGQAAPPVQPPQD